jgi:MFS family permease
MAFHTMAFLVTAPIGSLIAGVVADRIGPTRTIFAGGIVCLAAAGWFTMRLPALRTIVRPIYMERGIIAAAEIEGGRAAL